MLQYLVELLFFEEGVIVSTIKGNHTGWILTLKVLINLDNKYRKIKSL